MKKIFMIAATCAAVLATISCEKLEDTRSATPKAVVTKSFTSSFPQAFDVEWEWEGRYWEVSYKTGVRPDITEHEAYYDKDGNWIRTKTDMLLVNVPQQIKDYLAADPVYGTSPFADNDVEYIQTPDGDFYRFEIRYNGKEAEVDVTTGGNITFAKYDF